MPPVARRAKGVRALAGGDFLDQFGRLAAGHVVHLDAIAAGEAEQQVLVVRRDEHVGRHGAGLDAVGELLRVQIDHHQLVAVLHARPGGGALGVDPQMAGRLAGGDALGQRRVAAVPAVDVDVVEAVGRRDEPLHVGGKAQVVRVADAAQRALHLGRARVDEGERIAAGVGDDDRFFVRRQVQVVRLAAGGDALDLRPGDRVDDADVAVERIEHEHRRPAARWRGRARRQKRQRRQPEQAQGAAPGGGKVAGNRWHDSRFQGDQRV